MIKKVKTKQLKTGRHAGQVAVIVYDQAEFDPVNNPFPVMNEVTVAICRLPSIAAIVEGHLRKLFEGGLAIDAPVQALEANGDPKETVAVPRALFNNLKKAVEFKAKCDNSSGDAYSTGAMRDAYKWLATSAGNLVALS